MIDAKKLKSYSVLLMLAGSLSAFNNCGEFKTGEALVSTPMTSIDDASNPTLIMGKGLYQTNCANCHGALETSAKSGKSFSAIDDAIQRVPQMTHLNFLSASDLDALSMALNAPVGAVDSAVASSFRTPVSNRYLLASQLQNFFVAIDNPDASDAKIQGYIDTFVTSHPEAFGGNCSRNDPGCIPRPCGNDNACTGQLDASQIAEPDPTIGTTRKGYAIQVCEQILAVDKSVQTLLSGAGLSANSPPTAASVETLLGYVFPGQTVNGSVKTVLLNVSATSQKAGLSSLDQWRYLILPVCQSTSFDLL